MARGRARRPRRLGRRRRRAGRGCGRDRERAVPPTPERVAEIEERTQHDVAAFVDAVAEQLGPVGRWFHYGLTSSDVLDTALSLQIREAGELVLEGIESALEAVIGQAEKHRTTLMIGRTHGVHAEPTTFGLKLAVWAFELDRARSRMRAALEGLRVGKLSGAVGTSRPPTRRSSGSPANGWAWSPLRRRRRSCSATGTPSCWRPWPDGRLAREVRARDTAPRADRGAGGRRAVRARSERVVRDAAQAQSRRCRAHLRFGACRARRLRLSAWKTSRSGTSVTSRTPPPNGS